MDVLLSIKPEYAWEILRGTKKYEFRRLIFKNNNVRRIYLYVTSPVSKIVGSFEVGRIFENSPSALWKRYGKASGISKRDFFVYFKGSPKAFAIEIRKVQHFNDAIDPRLVFADFTPPQSFCYLPPSIPLLDPQDKRLTDY